MAELPVLGLRIGLEVSPVRECIDRGDLLTQSKFEYRKRSIEDIWGMINKHLGVDLPVEFIERMGFDAKDFKWRQLYHQNALSALFIGAASEKPFNLDGSQGIMEVISEVKQGKVEAETLSISGVIDDSKGIKRVIAVGFNLGEKIPQRVAISVAEKEIPEIEYSYYRNRISYRKCFISIPDTANALQLHRSLSLADFFAGALVSSGMVKQALGQRLMVESLNYRDSYCFRSPMVGEAGFSHSSGGGLNKIGFRSDWNVEYPASL